MAKSKSGGTRSYLRGRIASDVYSIGRDASGKKQQVVRSLAETVKNPQTVAQMRGRMIMSTVMQAVSGMSQIIDHSFDNVPNGQPSISEFIRRNYALIKADVAAHPASGNQFGLNKYQEKGVKAGAYLISDGKAIVPSAIDVTTAVDGLLAFKYTSTLTTAGQLRKAFGMGEEDYATLCIIDNQGKFVFFRVHVDYTLADDTVISADNVAQLFDIENPLGLSVAVTFTAGEIQIADSSIISRAGGVIFTDKVGSGFEHSETYLDPDGDPAFNADVALPTYPEGAERFLNGGEL